MRSQFSKDLKSKAAYGIIRFFLATYAHTCVYVYILSTEWSGDEAIDVSHLDPNAQAQLRGLHRMRRVKPFKLNIIGRAHFLQFAATISPDPPMRALPWRAKRFHPVFSRAGTTHVFVSCVHAHQPNEAHDSKGPSLRTFKS